jgi:hypothetical protein
LFRHDFSALPDLHCGLIKEKLVVSVSLFLAEARQRPLPEFASLLNGCVAHPGPEDRPRGGGHADHRRSATGFDGNMKPHRWLVSVQAPLVWRLTAERLIPLINPLPVVRDVRRIGGLANRLISKPGYQESACETVHANGHGLVVRIQLSRLRLRVRFPSFAFFLHHGFPLNFTAATGDRAPSLCHQYLFGRFML